MFLVFFSFFSDHVNFTEWVGSSFFGDNGLVVLC
jgi:hypothetical protein